MFSILRKSTSSLVKSSRSTPADQYDVVADELSTWEFVDPSLTDDDEDLCPVDEDDVISEESVSMADEEEAEEEKKDDACESRDLGPLDDITWLQSLSSVSPPIAFPVVVSLRHERYDDGEDELEQEEEDEDDVYDEDDVDDDLVPWELKGRYGKQRIMKMGKRGGPKPTRSSKLPCYYHHRPKSTHENRQVK